MSAEVDRLVLIEAATKGAEDFEAQGDAIREETIAKIMKVETTSVAPWWLFQRRPVTREEAEKVLDNNYRWWDHARTYWNLASRYTKMAENARCSKLTSIRLEEDDLANLRPYLGYQADE
ncbi:hypothetical protein D869_gp225 [Caulobacter phage CcrRogue]|uniref:Uncharacterized protein n=1 Tax=Caulobacter phage CcrRogue TaxID=2927986 RepID=K4JN96_9CAUD|nr:hypothetical protein D869_gp225 [Caulobacter phage CcrRogue]AFU86689.1 hypothetical protein CcrRogue_gp207 [Caulobacter phage CcrRogue]